MQEISIFMLFGIARRRIWALILAFVVAAGLAFSYCRFVADPVYGASASIIVTNGAVVTANTDQEIQKVLGSDIQASLLLANSVVDMLKTPDIFKYLASRLNDKDYGKYMAATTVVRRSDESLLVDITYNEGDPEKAIKIVNMFASVACDYIAEFIPKANPKIVSKAQVAKLVAPRTVRMTALFGIGAAFVLYAIFVLIEILNDTVGGEEEFTSRYDIPLLGSVPDFDEARKGRSGGKGRYYY